MKSEAVIEFLKHRFNVNDISNIDPYALDCDAHHAHELASWNVTQFDLTTQDTITHDNQIFSVLLKDGDIQGGMQALVPEKTFQNQAVDLDRAIVNSIRVNCVDARNTPNVEGIRVLGRLNHDHQLLPHLSAHDDEMACVDGHVRGAALYLKPGEKQPCNEIFYQPEPHYVYLNNYFIKTFGLLDESNIDNGIIKLPANVAAQSMALPSRSTVKGPNGTSKPLEFNTYYLVPYDHVYAWMLRLPVDDFRRQIGIHAIELRVQNPGRILYYVVGDICFEAIREGVFKTYLGKIVTSCLGTDIGFEWVVSQKPEQPAQIPLDCTIHAQIGFLCFPKNINTKQIARLRPTLSEDYIPYSTVFSNNLRQLAEKQQEKQSRQLREKSEQAQADLIQRRMEAQQHGGDGDGGKMDMSE